MKIHLLSDNLQKKLSFVNHAISQKSQLPILLHYLLESKDGKCIISATDLEIGIQVGVSANVEEEGGITIPAKIFTDLINSLPSETITLQVKDQKLEVIGKKTKTVFQTIPKDDFPKLYEQRGDRVAVFSGKSLKQDIASVVFATSIDTTRPGLSGVLIKNENGGQAGFIIVATDGYRLSLRRIPIQSSISQTKTLLIPGRVFKEVLLMRQIDEDITLYVSENSNQVIFEGEGCLVIGRLIDAQFPNYEKIIPTDFSSRILFDREEMQKAVKICSLFAKDAAHIVKFQVEKDKIIVSANMPSVGENTVEVEAKLDGEENEIAFNGRYLLDFLSSVDGNDIIFEMNGPLSPGVFKVKGNDSFFHLIMPIRVQN